jgi:hypothetical protein
MNADDELKPLGDELEALLDSERQAPPAPTAARARVRTRLYASLGLLGAGSASAAALSGAPKLVWKALAAKISVGLVAAVSIGVGLHAIWSGPAPLSPNVLPPVVAQPAGPPPEPAAPVLPAPAITAPVTVPAPAVVPAPAADRAPHPSPVATKGARRAHPAANGALFDGGDLAGERALLEEGRAALRRGDAPTALGLLGQHAQKFPRGQLIEEREGLRIRALAADGQEAEAKARAAAFKTRFPHSIFLPAVEATFK